MSKSLRMITVFFIIFMLLMPVFVQATEVNMNLTANTTTQNTTTDNTNTSEQQTTNQSQTSSESLSPTGINYATNSPTVTTLNQLPESTLGLNNVLNIILIVIGILLILLGIAIIIRLKH